MRRLGLLILALALGLGARLALPPLTIACSCAMLDQPMHLAAADPASNVFTGRAGPLVADGVAITLTGWFHGPPPPAGVAWLDPAGFVDPMGGSCGTNPPTVGTEWIFVAGRNQVGRYDMSLCSTAAPVDTDQGQALLAEATEVFGPPVIRDPVLPGTKPSAKPEPGPVSGAASDIAVVLPVLLIAVFAAGAVVGAFAIVGRRRGGVR